MTGAEYRGLGDIIVTARPFDEYAAMFDLHDADLLAGPVLDCPAGASGFAHGARALGADVTAVDPVYDAPHGDLIDRARRDTAFGNRYVRENPDTYAWDFFIDVDDHLTRRLGAVDAFDADRRAHADRYVAGALPALLSSHLLFVYPDHFDTAAHLAGVRELARVCSGEVRMFPLVDTTTAPWPHLDQLRRDLERAGHGSEVRPVPYEFIRGGSEMLVVDGSAHPDA
jgi:hypothetical protein